MVQWLRLQVSNEGGAGLIPCQGTKIPHVKPYNQKNTYTHTHTHTNGKPRGVEISTSLENP